MSIEDESIQKSERMYGVQLLRAIGCLSIVVAHSFAYAEANYGMVMGETLNYWGRYAMLAFTEVFFGISGFFVWSSIDRSKSSASFLIKKLRRLLPLYWLAIVACIFLYLFFNRPMPVNKYFLQAFFLVPNANVPYVLRNEWTLILEAQFYIFCAFFASERMKKYFKWFAAFWLLAIPLGSYYYHIGPEIACVWPKSFFSQRNFGFLAGMAAAWLVNKEAVKKYLSGIYVYILGIASLAGYVAIYEWFGMTLLGQLFHYAVLIPMLLAFSQIKISKNNFFTVIGDRSYGIYLLHPTLLDISFWQMNQHGIKLSPIAFIIALLITLPIGAWFGQFDDKLNRLITEYKRISGKIRLRQFIIYLIPL